MVGLITVNNNETAYREEVRDQAVWWRLKRFFMGSQILKKYYSCTIESISVASPPSMATARPPP
jgi:hypothetical protein